MENDRQAILAAIKTGCDIDPDNVRMVRIKNTLHLEEIQLSTALIEEARRHPQIKIIGDPVPLLFDADGYLTK